ncbi:E3 ubiquitin-protein ligase RHF1A-like [Tasmannia lanceolata]|uniref:E3 ubiquitin-protein ligase RHF1A-like n=1 Tax=Tasmannia lanceolata TaxID=3420 RepID=UPI0040639B57
MEGFTFPAGIPANCDDECSICLEPFSVEDPATVTKKQRVPDIWQLLVLKDPVSQELLAAVEMERSLRSRHICSNVPSIDRNRTHSQTPVVDPVESNSSGNFPSPEGNSTTATLSPAMEIQPQASVPLSHGPGIVDDKDGPVKPRILSIQTTPGPQRSRQSKLLSFSKSLKSRLSAASSRYKESISKGTKGFKDIHNHAIKIVVKGAHRDVTASIARVSQMMERLDHCLKRNRGFCFVSNAVEGNPESSPKGHLGVAKVHVQNSYLANSHSCYFPWTEFLSLPQLVSSTLSRLPLIKFLLLFSLFSSCLFQLSWSLFGYSRTSIRDLRGISLTFLFSGTSIYLKNFHTVLS